MSTSAEIPAKFAKMAADIVSAYVSHNSVPAGELSALIASIHASLGGVFGPQLEAAPKQEPAISIKRSVTDDHIVCLEDGKKFKSLRRHLSTKYGLTPDAYRAKWGLPSDYPMVAPAYAKTRSELAKKAGLSVKASSASKSKKAA